METHMLMDWQDIVKIAVLPTCRLNTIIIKILMSFFTEVGGEKSPKFHREVYKTSNQSPP